MSDLSKVKEINVVNDIGYANKHLANGWVLIAVNSVSGTDKSGNISVSTQYVLGWEGALPSKRVTFETADPAASKYAPQYDYSSEPGLARQQSKPKPKAKPITIIE